MSDLKTVLIEDARLAQISDDITFGVSSGANQSSYQQFTAVSSSSSSVVYNVIVPSEAVAIDKNILLRQTINLTFKVSGVPDGEVGWSYGILDAFQAFPFNSLMTTCNATINNASISTNVRDVLPSLVRMSDSRELQRYRGMCPCLPDTMYANLCETYQNIDLTDLAANPIAMWQILPNGDSQLGNAMSSGLDSNFVPRGAFPLDYINIQHFYTASGIVSQDSSLVSTGDTDTWTIEVSATTTEPLMCLSPFTSNMFSTNQGALIGINNMNFNFNIDSTCSRVWSSAGYSNDPTTLKKLPYIDSISLGNSYSGQLPFTNTQMLLNFLTLQPHQYAHIKSKNILPYYDTPRYLSNQNQNSSIAGWGSNTAPVNGNFQLIGSTGDITSTSLQLNIVPDYLIITVRKPMSNQTFTDPNGFLIVNKMSLSFNNSQGLCSQMTQQDLWRMSVRNGSSQTWEEFSGKKNMTQNISNDISNNIPGADTGQNWVSGTCGSMIVISPNDLNLPDFLAGSSLGQFQVFFTLNVSNQYFESITPEICVVAVNSGTFTTIQGQSVFNTGILTKQSVLEAKQQAPIDRLDTAEYARLVGGHGMDEKSLSALKKSRS